MLFNKKQGAAAELKTAAPVPGAVMPRMSEEALGAALAHARGGPATALLRYTGDHYELVVGAFEVVNDQDGWISYWVGDRLVATIGSAGEPVPVPALFCLRPDYVFPFAQLTTETLEPFRR
jgi:hypothetical protein